MKNLFLRYAKSTVITSLFLFLVSTNILSLTSDTAHEKMYQVLKQTLSLPWIDYLSRKVSSKPILDGSPTANVDRKVAQRSDAMRKEFEREKNVLLNEKSVLQKEKALLQNEKALLNQKIGQNREAIKKLAVRVAPRVRNTAMRHFAGAAPESVPIFGTALIWSLTAWDIYDACETLKDINALYLEADIKNVEELSICGFSIPLSKEPLKPKK